MTLYRTILLLTVCIAFVNSVDVSAGLRTSPLIAQDISNLRVNAIAEDTLGHIWLGTFRGLNKYNVYEYHQYFTDDDMASIPDNQIVDLLCDSKGRLWVSTINGVCLYTDYDNFRRIHTDIDNKNGVQLLEDRKGRILLNSITHLSVYNSRKNMMECVVSRLNSDGNVNIRCFIDKRNDLWVVSPGSLRRYDTTTFKQMDSIPLNGIPAYFCYTNDEIWVAGGSEICVFDTRTRRFIILPADLSRNPILKNCEITGIFAYDNRYILLNTSRHGLWCYDMIEKTFTPKKFNEGMSASPSYLDIQCVFTDSRKNLWIGTRDKGYIVQYKYKERFTDNLLNTTIGSKSVLSVASGHNMVLWISTHPEGLYRYDIPKAKVESINQDKLFSKERKGHVSIKQILIDDADTVWLMCESGEILKCQYLNGDLQIVGQYHVPRPMSMVQSSDGTIWIGTVSNTLYHLSPGEKAFSPVRAFERSFTFIPGLQPLDNGQVLAAAFFQPLKRIDSSGLKIDDVKWLPGDFDRCIRRSVFIPTALFRDRQGDIWIGTVSNGLLHYYPSNGHIEAVGGIECGDISAIEEDNTGCLWVSTLHGLSKYDRSSGKAVTYYKTDGIGGDQFNDRASCRMSDGTLVFGGTHGITIFNPMHVSEARQIPLLFENLKVHNQIVRPEKDGCIDRHLSLNPDINLTYRQNGFSISFAALDYSEYERVRYQYRLEGFDQYWVDANNNREAYYANVPSGEYVFKVRIIDQDSNVIRAENELKVTVHPAPWNTTWARIGYVLLFALISIMVYHAIYRLRAEKSAAKRAAAEKEQEQRVNRMNMNFFANISHEFRTPLTMISAPIEQLYGNPQLSQEEKNLLGIVRRSVDRLLRLVNQLLDFHKLDNDALKLSVARSDFSSFLKGQVGIFRLTAAVKNIRIEVKGLDHACLTWMDADKLEKVFANLMSNALKHTPQGGRIVIEAKVSGYDETATVLNIDNHPDWKYMVVTVANTGENIPSDELDKIFERYYRLDEKQEESRRHGAGIGLYYARRLMLLHHGQISASNPKEGAGAVFCFAFPICDEAYPPDERREKRDETSDTYVISDEIMERVDFPQDGMTDKKSILVVDDDAEMVHYLQALLSPEYVVDYCFDAASALESMRRHAPDLVLCDVVMPDKSGYELCREIKEDKQICHIPVILVTAKNSTENQIEGLKTGADAYVAKPFSPTYLLALIKSQLDNRERIRKLLQQNTRTAKISDTDLSEYDSAFMDELYKLMNAELSNPELDIIRIAEKMRISRTKFYYKVKGLTGETPSVFFKTFKLNRAAELLADNEYNISEIADMTGFNVPSRFSRAFKLQFGMTPSEYRAQHRNNSD